MAVTAEAGKQMRERLGKTPPGERETNGDTPGGEPRTWRLATKGLAKA